MKFNESQEVIRIMATLSISCGRVRSPIVRTMVSYRFPISRSELQRVEEVASLEFSHHFIDLTVINMAAIGLDILNIGSSKWSQDMETNIDALTSEGAPSHFMLPAVENVSYAQHKLCTTVSTLLYCYYLYFLQLYSLLSFAELISMLRKAKIMTKKLSS